MEYRVLGPVELWSAGRQHDLGPARTRCVLAMLLLAPRAIVPADTLIDRLWGSSPPPKARESLSVYIARLRAALRLAVGDSVQLAGRARGYVLDVEAETVDVHQFRRLRRQAGALAASGDYVHAAGLLREADALWRGAALGDIDGDWAARMRDSLEEERRAAIVERVGCELEAGHHADLVGELRQLLGQYPLDETLVAHQMTALYRAGRAADALALYRDTRRRLVDEQGTEPGPLVAGLHQRILAGDPGLAAAPGPGGPGWVPLPGTLPETGPFVGRQAELEVLAGGQGSAPGVAVIEGMPGVGKTALAVHAARALAARYPDGTLYLDLCSPDPAGPSPDAAGALHELLRMMSGPATGVPDALGERVALWRAQLARRRAIVILENATRPDQVRPLLSAPGQSLILITTRRRLAGLSGVRTLSLDVLAPGDAVALFRRVAGEGRATDTGEVAEVARLCGWLPLAIQLAAGRVAQHPKLSLADLTDELSHSPARLGCGAANPEVVSAFDVSYQALEPDHQRFFRRLGLSPCDRVSLEAAAALGGCTLAEAEKAVATLLDYHLLTRAPDGQFGFHDLIRGYAAVRASRDEPAAAQRQATGRLLDYYLHTADQAERTLQPFRRRAPVQVTQPPATSPVLATREAAAGWLDSQRRNILQAARYAARHEWNRKCADLTDLLAGFLETRAYWDEAVGAHTLALQACRELADPARTARALLALCVVRQQTGRHEVARQLAEEAASVSRTLADPGGEAAALDQLGLTYQRTARSREALAYFHEARLRYLQAGDRRGVADALSHAGIACWHLGRYPEATAQLTEALALYQAEGDERGEAKTLNNLGRIHLYRGLHRDALEAYQRSLEIFRVIGGAQNEAILYHNIGSVHHYKGSFEEALAACRRALAIYRGIGDLPDEADVLNDIGAIYASASCPDEALVHHEKALAVAEEVGDASQRLIALRNIADIHRGAGQFDEAFGCYDTALRLARELGDPYEEGKVLEGLAELTLATQPPAAARIVFRQALDIFERLGVPEAESARIRLETMDPAFGLSASQAVS